jgi:hypothetical protein
MFQLLAAVMSSNTQSVNCHAVIVALNAKHPMSMGSIGWRAQGVTIFQYSFQAEVDAVFETKRLRPGRAILAASSFNCGYSSATVPVTPVHSPVAIDRNRWSRSIGAPGRHQWESVVAITRYAQECKSKRHSTAN